MKDLKFLENNLIAHRGYHNTKKSVPENSIKAFRRAVRYGYIIELDIHLLKDGNIVVFHDDNLKRVCGVNKNINDCTYDEIKHLKLFNTNEKIPLLEDVLKVVDGKVPILIEIKYYSKYGGLERKLFEILNNYKGIYAIQSFYPKTIYWLKKNKPDVIRGLLSSDFKNKGGTLRQIIGKTLILDIILKTDFISFDIRALPNFFVDKKKMKKRVLGWTVRTKKDYDLARKCCDNLICENMEEYK